MGTDSASGGALPMWLTPSQGQLLMAAEVWIRGECCQNRCKHRRANTPAFDCPEFDVKVGGYLECTGYVGV